jgi:hypothetical protein
MGSGSRSSIISLCQAFLTNQVAGLKQLLLADTLGKHCVDDRSLSRRVNVNLRCTWTLVAKYYTF